MNAKFSCNKAHKLWCVIPDKTPNNANKINIKNPYLWLEKHKLNIKMVASYFFL